ncbi:hypothetical protein [Carboxylicivirga linearis]|uniref:Uncharacterized protein n=1 Tax=Carboxylicivirga linearis TaxID=1628157 RepID=A0ABS5K0I2_9BACT|nr:hypothetical protein [Carboxylicivirga linearis]MBS2100682.1 hypothetical protein [Carboxylicivirga linearis]
MSKVGKRVLYKFGQNDVEFIDALRVTDGGVNPAKVGDQYPGVIVADWSQGEYEGCVNISVTLDGCVLPMWKTSVMEGTGVNEYTLID